MKKGIIKGLFAVAMTALCAVAQAETARLQGEIDRVSSAGGGRVTVGRGVHTVGTLWLRDNVELHLEEGAVLRASTDKADYNALDAFPENFSVPAENWVGRHLIVAHSVTNVALTGAGVIDGSGEDFLEERVWSVSAFGRRDRMRGDEPSTSARRLGSWMHGIRWSKAWDDPRPGQMVLFVKCRDVRVEGVALVNSPCWNLYVWGCDRATVRDVTVRASRSAANTDGIDIDCSSDVLVERCDIDVGDDGITFRGSERRLGIRKPCERVRVRDCSIAVCSAPFRFGVGTGLVRDILIENCRVWRGGGVLTFCCTFEGRGGCDIENVTVRNVVAEGCSDAGLYRNCPLGPDNEFGIRNVRTENCDFAHSPAGYGVVADGRPVRLHKVRRRVRPADGGRAGVSRSLTLTEEAAFASVTSAGPVTFEVTPPKGGGEVRRLTVPGPGRYAFGPDGSPGSALTLIVNPPKAWNEKWTRTFGPGEHYVGTLRLKSGDRIFLDENAVLHGNIVGEGVRDVKICGTGVVDTGCYERFGVAAAANGVRSAGNVALVSCRDVAIDGPVLVDAAEKPVMTTGCERITLDNVKELGQWRNE